MECRSKDREASRGRQRKCALIRQFRVPDTLWPGSLSWPHTHCGNPPCHCAQGEGHPVWSLTFMVKGKKRVERIPLAWMKDVRRRVQAGREFQDAVREVLAANAQLWVLARKQRRR